MKRHLFARMGRVFGRRKSNVTSTGIEQNRRTTGNIQSAIVVKINQSGCDTEPKSMFGWRQSAIAVTEKQSVTVIVSSHHQVEGAVPVNIATLQASHC